MAVDARGGLPPDGYVRRVDPPGDGDCEVYWDGARVASGLTRHFARKLLREIRANPSLATVALVQGS